MARSKIGFHVGVGGNRDGFGEYLRQLAMADIKVLVKSADDFGVVAQVVAASVANEVIVRWTQPTGRPNDHPDLNADPRQEAEAFWSLWQQYRLPELRPYKNNVWLEPTNEIDTGANAVYLNDFCLRLIELATVEGWKLAIPGFNAGQPECDPQLGEAANQWLHELRPLLEAVSGNPNVLFSVHEGKYYDPGKGMDMYSPVENSIPFYTGRFTWMFDTADALGLARPLVAVTEWAWAYNDMPDVATAMRDVEALAAYYAQFPEVLGATLWTLGGGRQWAGLPDKLQRLIAPLTAFTLTTSFPDPEPPGPPPTAPQTWQQRAWAASVQQQIERGIQLNKDAALQQEIDAAGMRIVANELGFDGAVIQPAETYDGRIPRRVYVWQPGKPVWWFSNPDTSPPPVAYPLTYRPCDTTRITQQFGANPASYAPYGLPGHDGLDYGVPAGEPFYAAANGRVVHASDRRWSSSQASDYGWHVVLDHGSFCTVYAHGRVPLPVAVGQQVQAGEVVACSGNTGNSRGYHLHFGLLSKTDTGNGYPLWRYGQPVDPEPHTAGLSAPPTTPAPTQIDMGRYFTAPGGMGDIVNLANNFPNGGNERQQIQGGGDVWFITKNSQYERRVVGKDRVYLTHDTSPGGNQYYVVASPTGWMPRWWSPGEQFMRSETATFYHKDGCKATGSAFAMDSPLRFVAHYTEFVTTNSDGRHQLAFDDVVEVQWLVNGVVEETYWYAAFIGLIQWQRRDGLKSWAFEHVPLGHQQSNVMETIPCLII